MTSFAGRSTRCPSDFLAHFVHDGRCARRGRQLRHCLGAGVAVPKRHGHRPFRRRQRRRRDTAHCPGSSVKTGWTCHRRRKSRGSWRHPRLQHGREGRAGRSHGLGNGRLGYRAQSLPETSIRHAAGFRAGDPARAAAHGSGDRAIQGFQDARRPDFRRQGEARRAEFRLGRRGLRVALCGRTAAHQCRNSRSSTSRSGGRRKD